MNTQNNLPKQSKHQALLIRWQDNGTPIRWRAIVENIYTGEKMYFRSKSRFLLTLSKLMDQQQLIYDEVEN